MGKKGYYFRDTYNRAFVTYYLNKIMVVIRGIAVYSAGGGVAVVYAADSIVVAVAGGVAVNSDISNRWC